MVSTSVGVNVDRASHVNGEVDSAVSNRGYALSFGEDFEAREAGHGPLFYTSDGSTRYRIRGDKNRAIVTETL